MITVAIGMAAWLLAAPIQAQEGQEPKVPKDSVRLLVAGCLTGRVIAPMDVRNTDSETAALARARAFRVAGKKDLMKQVKAQDGQYVEVTGLVRKADLRPPGLRIKGTPIILSGGSGTAPTRNGPPDPSPQQVVIDISGIEPMGRPCPGSGR